MKIIKHSKKNNALLILFILILFITTFFYQDYTTKKLLSEKEFFIKNTKSFIIPHVTVGGIKYYIKDGEIVNKGNNISLKNQVKIYRTAYYSLLTRIDPFFAIPNTDLNALKRNIGSLDTSIQDLALYYSQEEGRTLSSSLYPINFLNNLANLEIARRSVVNSPSQTNIKKYNNSLQKTIRVYKDNLRKLNGVYNNQVYEKVTYNYPLGSVSISEYRKFVNSIQDAAQDIDIKEKNRFSCFDGVIKKCTLTSNTLARSPILTTEYSSLNQKKSYNISPIIDELRQINRAYYPTDIYSEEVIEKYKNVPVVVLKEGFCSPNERDLYYDIAPREFKGSPIDRVVLLDDAYFYDLTQDHPQLGALYLKTKGIFPVSYQPLVTPYFCPDYGLDSSKVMTIIKIRSLLEEYNLFTEIESNINEVEYNNLNVLEKNITTHPIVYESDIILFLNALINFLDTQADIELFFTDEDVLFIEELLLLYKTQTADFDQLLLGSASDALYVTSFIELGSKAGLFDLFLTRATPSLTYLAFNKSIFYKSPPRILTHQEDNINAFLPLSYRKDIRFTYSLEEVIHIIEELDSFKRANNLRL